MSVQPKWKHRACPCGCGELADECMSGRSNPLTGAFRAELLPPRPATTTALCGTERHRACQDRYLFTTGHCQCDCHARAEIERGAPTLLVLPATFHPLRGYIAKTRDVERLVGCAPRDLEAVADGPGWRMFADTLGDDKALPPNGYAARLLRAIDGRERHYVAGTVVVAGGDEQGALSSVPADIVRRAQEAELIIKETRP